MALPFTLPPPETLTTWLETVMAKPAMPNTRDGQHHLRNVNCLCFN